MSYAASAEYFFYWFLAAFLNCSYGRAARYETWRELTAEERRPFEYYARHIRQHSVMMQGIRFSSAGPVEAVPYEYRSMYACVDGIREFLHANRHRFRH